MKRMLFNATQPEESRVAIVDGQKLINLDIETSSTEQRKGNIYKGVITKVEPSLEACFIDYGMDRHGFLPFKEIHRSYYKNSQGGGRPKVQDAISEGDEVLVQVEKDERGNKGAALTTYISLAGRYLVLMPNNPRGGGVSRRIEGEERIEIKNAISQLNIPKGMSVIARTAGIGRAVEELQWDLDYQLKLWDAVVEASRQENVQSLILQESALVIRVIRDHYQPDIGEILIDNKEVYDKVCQFISFVMPQNFSKVKFYEDHTPLFSRFQIESQIDSVYAREVSLPSGGEIVIDHTEALVSIDVNSAKATKGSDVEETALQTNLEAAEEISRQMRLRDIGGLVVIDFIDMEDSKHQREVEMSMRTFLKEDKARVQITKLSRFGLMEISRQRLQVSLGESTHMTCPRCYGRGVIRGVQSSAIHILRGIEEMAMKENTGEVIAQVPVDAATFLLNEKREKLFGLEERLGVPIIIIPNKHLEIPHYSVERIKSDDVIEDSLSYAMVNKPEEKVYESSAQRNRDAGQIRAAVQSIQPSAPAPEKVPVKKSLLSGLSGWLSHLFKSDETKKDSVKSVSSNSQSTINNCGTTANNRRRTSTANKNRNNATNDKNLGNKKDASESKVERISKNVKDNKSANSRNSDKKATTRQSRNVKAKDTEKTVTENIGQKETGKHEAKSNSKSNVNKQDTNKFNGKTQDSNKQNVNKKNSNKQNTNKFEAKNGKNIVKQEPLVVNLSEGSSNAPNNKANKNSKNNGSKNTRYRISSASYLESKIKIDRLTRYIQRMTNNVLKAEGLLGEGIDAGVIKNTQQLTGKTKEILKNELESTVIDVEQDTEKSKAKTEKSEVSLESNLVLVETDQTLLNKRQEVSEFVDSSQEIVLRRNDIEITLDENEVSGQELQQVETK